MIKIVADHAGVQVNADQSNTTTSHIENMTIAAQQDRRVNVRDYVGDITYTYDGDQAASQTYTLINAGYTEE